jgi:hypothetical protein
VDSPDFKVIVENNQVNEITIDRYNITVEIQDAGGQQDSAEVSFVVDYGVKVENMVTKRLVSRIDTAPWNNMQGPNDETVVYQYVTDFEVTEGPAAALGWYRYNGPWDRTDGEGVNIVTELALQNIQETFQNAEWSCDNGCDYSYPFGVAVGFLVDGADNVPGASGAAIPGTTGGGINIDLNTMNATILGRTTPPRTANLDYPLTGSRMIRAITQADLDLTWRANCKYFAGPPYSPNDNPPGLPGVNGIFTQVFPVDKDALTSVEYPISDAIVNQYNWQVEL